MSRTIDLHSRVVRAASYAALIAFGLWLCGCVTQPKEDPYAKVRLGGQGTSAPRPPPIDPMQVPERDNIVRIFTIWGNVPWITDGDRFAIGVKARVYFVDSETERGAFVTGRIGAALYTVTPTPSGRSQRVLVHEWKLDRDQAAGYRIRRKAVTGYSYGLVLLWPEEVEVIGRQIEVVFTYERSDGTLIRSSRKRIRVPTPVGYRPTSGGG